MKSRWQHRGLLRGWSFRQWNSRSWSLLHQVRQVDPNTSQRDPHGSNERLTSGFVVFVLHVPVLSIASGLARFESRRLRRL